jgi:TonB family protein
MSVRQGILRKETSMNRTFHLAMTVLVCSLFSFAQTATPPTEQAQEAQTSSNSALPNTMGVGLDSLDGTWEGDLTYLHGATLSPKGATVRYRITIQGSSVQVYLIQPQGVKEVKSGAFHIERLMTNAVIYATDSGHDNEGTWVETWVFAVTRENGTTLLTNFGRLVNNLDLPFTSDHSKFAKAAAGELKLIPASSSEQNQTPQPPPPPAMSAGSSIEQAARAAAANRGGYDGDGGNYGLGLGKKATAAEGPIEILTDTMGVDFKSYLKKVLDDIRKNWYNLIPEEARAPLMKKGKVTIEFAIKKDGTVAGMRLVSTSGNVALDRGAWGGITGSNPFTPLPAEFGGQYLGLRFTFYYNPSRADLGIGPPPSPTGQSSSKSGIKVSISQPYGAEVPIGESVTVVATVTGSTNTAVKWSITGSDCSGSACGIMNGDSYQAPKVLPSPRSVVLKATSKADPKASAWVTVYVVQPIYPVDSSGLPNK